MSGNTRATKRKQQTIQSSCKMHKLSLPDNGEEKVVIYPKTSTTRAVLEKFENRLAKEKPETKVLEIDKNSPCNIKSPSPTISTFDTEAKKKTNVSTTNIRRANKKVIRTDVSKIYKYSPCNIKTLTSETGVLKQSSENSQSKGQTAANTINSEKYSPKNIKSSPTSNSSSLKSKRMLNCLQNKPCVETPTSSTNRIFFENITPSCSHADSGDQGCLMELDISEEIQSQPLGLRSIPIHPRKLLRKAEEERQCEQNNGEEEMSLFFQKLLPYTAALTWQKRREFKSIVASSLERIIGGELQEIFFDN